MIFLSALETSRLQIQVLLLQSVRRIKLLLMLQQQQPATTSLLGEEDLQGHNGVLLSPTLSER
jgi:hypothetical protein